MAAWDIYAEQLMHLGHGHALWGPEPCPDNGEVHLGDIGYLRDGYFCFLFNATRNADDLIHQRRGVPDGFEIFEAPQSTIVRRPNHITQTRLHSKSLQSVMISTTASVSETNTTSASVGLRYQCTEESGALLLLKQPAHKMYLDCKMHIRRYIRKHITSWIAFANDRYGIGLEEKDIIFVSGTTKTSVWAEAAFRNSSSSGELLIAGGGFMPSISGEFRVSMARGNDASVFSRCGPFDRISYRGGENELQPPTEEYDQSIFLNYYKMKNRGLFRIPSVIRGAAGYDELPDSGLDNEGATGSSPTGRASWDERESDEEGDESGFSPLDPVLDYILKYSNASVACASDCDLTALFEGQYPADVSNALELLAPEIVVEDNGMGTILISTERRDSKYVTDSLVQRDDTPTPGNLVMTPVPWCGQPRHSITAALTSESNEISFQKDSRSDGTESFSSRVLPPNLSRSLYLEIKFLLLASRYCSQEQLRELRLPLALRERNIHKFMRSEYIRNLFERYLHMAREAAGGDLFRGSRSVKSQTQECVRALHSPGPLRSRPSSNYISTRLQLECPEIINDMKGLFDINFHNEGQYMSDFRNGASHVSVQELHSKFSCLSIAESTGLSQDARYGLFPSRFLSSVFGRKPIPLSLQNHNCSVTILKRGHRTEMTSERQAHGPVVLAMVTKGLHVQLKVYTYSTITCCGHFVTIMHVLAPPDSHHLDAIFGHGSDGIWSLVLITVPSSHDLTLWGSLPPLVPWPDGNKPTTALRSPYSNTSSVLSCSSPTYVSSSIPRDGTCA